MPIAFATFPNDHEYAHQQYCNKIRARTPTEILNKMIFHLPFVNIPLFDLENFIKTFLIHELLFLEID